MRCPHIRHKINVRVEFPDSLRMHIVLNGEEKTLATVLTVTQLLEQMGLTGRRVAVEVNQEIVPRSRHGEVELREHDQVEVVFAIGGG